VAGSKSEEFNWVLQQTR